MLTRSTPCIKDAHGSMLPHSLASLESIELGGVKQWLLIRGEHHDLPVLLYLHGGPGGAQIGWARPFQRTLEEHFVVVSWDQRGAGLSYSRQVPTDSLTVKQFTEDTLALVHLLRQRFATRKVYLLGHSWGSILGMVTVQQAPECFQAYIGVGQMARNDENERRCWQWTLETAQEQGNQKAMRQLEQLGSPPYRDGVRSAAKRSYWTDRFGGQWYQNTIPAAMGRHLFTSPEYTLFDVYRFFRGQRFSLQHTWEELASLNLMERVPKVEIPVYFCMGRHDHAAAPELAQQYFERLTAPKKTWMWFEHCAHFLPFENPEQFLNVLVQIKQENS